MNMHDLYENDTFWKWLTTGIALLAVVLLSIDIGIRWGQAGSQIHKRCVGEAAVYYGSVRDDGVMSVSGYDRECAERIPDTQPTFEGP